MTRRLLILRAGSAASNNLVRSLKAGDSSLDVVGCNDDRFVLKKSLTDRNHLVPNATQREFPAALRRVIAAERIDLLIPTSDADVARISGLRDRLPCRTFLPRSAVIKRCQDKYALTTFLRSRHIPAPLTYPVTSLQGIDGLFRRLAPRSQLWCRIRRGTGSAGAIPVRNPEQVRSWIRYFREMRGVPATAFTLSEYLPGRDYCVQSLWKDGRLVLTKMAERLTYLDSGSPSGMSSTPALAKTVSEPRVFQACTKAIRALDPKASGIFFADVKESTDEEPCITEINAGRFATITNIHDLTGKHNMAVMYVRLALGEEVELRNPYDFAQDHYLVRSVDTLPAVIHGDELFKGIRDTSR